MGRLKKALTESLQNAHSDFSKRLKEYGTPIPDYETLNELLDKCSIVLEQSVCPPHIMSVSQYVSKDESLLQCTDLNYSLFSFKVGDSSLPTELHSEFFFHCPSKVFVSNLLSSADPIVKSKVLLFCRFCCRKTISIRRNFHPKMLTLPSLHDDQMVDDLLCRVYGINGYKLRGHIYYEP
jgi:hypothetical protein